MLKQTVKYTDFNGNENEEVLYFHLNKQELTRMELGHKDGMSEYIKEVIGSGDNLALVDMFSNLILDSYGIKSEDGKRFIKSAKLREEFEQSLAFSEFFMNIISNPELAETFVTGAMGQ